MIISTEVIAKERPPVNVKSDLRFSAYREEIATSVHFGFPYEEKVKSK